MAKKILFISTFIILNIIFSFTYNFFLKKYNYNSIILETEKNKFNYYDKKIRLALKKFGFNFKPSDFVVFDKIQVWRVKNNVILSEKIEERNYKNILRYLDEKDRYDYNKYDIFLFQIFHHDKIELKKNLNRINNEIMRLNDEISHDCLKKNETKKEETSYIKKIYKKDNDNLFLKYLFDKKILENSKLAKCINLEIKLYKPQQIQKYNILFLSFISTLIVMLSIFFLVSLINDIKER
jgi:hypothetical protein